MFIPTRMAGALVDREVAHLKENPAAQCLGAVIDLAANIIAVYSPAQANARCLMNQSGYDLRR